MPASFPARRSFLAALVAGTAIGSGMAAGDPIVEAALAARVRRLLADAAKGRAWTTGRGVRRWPILVGGTQHGTVWEDVDPRRLTIGDSWQAGSGWRVELVHEGRVVGMLWLDHE